MPESVSPLIRRDESDYQVVQRMLTRDAVRRPRRRIANLCALLVAGAIVFGLSHLVLSSEDGGPFALVVVLAVFGAWGLLLLVLGLLFERKLYPPLRWFRLPYRVAISETGVRVTGDHQVNNFDWRAFNNIFVNATHILFRYDQTALVVVPKRSFESPDQAAAFAQAAQRLHQAHGEQG